MSIAHMKLTKEQFDILSPVLPSLCQVKLRLTLGADAILDSGEKVLELDLDGLVSEIAKSFSMEEAMLLSGAIDTMLSLQGVPRYKVMAVPREEAASVISAPTAAVEREKASDGLEPADGTIFMMAPRSAG